MINPGEECVKRSQGFERKLADFTFEYYKLSEQSNAIAKRLKELDLMVTDLLASAKINNIMAKEFDTYLAIKEGAITLDDIQKGVQFAGDIEEK